MKEAALIEVKRESAYADKLRDYQVELDGKVIGSIGDGESKTFKTTEGIHTLQLRIDWAKSNTLQLKTTEQDTVHFRCSSRLKGASVLLASVYALLLSHKYIVLEQID